jgi:4-hydroxymandelate oxidase
MNKPDGRTIYRRQLLRFLFSSPLLALSGATWLGDLLEAAETPSEIPRAPIITSPSEAINVFDFEAAAREKLPPAHFGYLTTGVDDDATLRANRAGFSKFQIRPRRLVDVASVDPSLDLFGATWKSPIVLAPAASQKAFHPDGEIAAARAAGAKGHLMILSTGTTASVEDVRAAHGGPIWFQLYPTDTWRIAQALVKRAEAAGCPVLVLTVDLPAGRNTETERRFARTDTRQCSSCHAPSLSGYVRRKPMFDGLNVTGVGLFSPQLTWDVVRRLKDTTRMKLVLKGIETREDAELCLRHGVDGIIVSNHGGRSMDYGPSTLEVLPEIVAAVNRRVPILTDSGYRRGADILKALAIGADAVLLGRTTRWALGAFGAPGAQRLLEMMQQELVAAAAAAGRRTHASIDKTAIRTHFV